MSGVVSTKLKFKGDKPKKKKRSHRETGGGGDTLEALATADPTGWMFPETVGEVTGPSYILLPTEPLTCLAWDSTRQRVYAAPVDMPQAPEGANELSLSEALNVVEPTAVDQVWVVSRLAGSEEVSLRTSTGTFLTAAPSGTLTATSVSRGPLEGFTATLEEGSLFPSVALKTNSGTYLSVPPADAEDIKAKKAEIRGDAETSTGDSEKLRIKCQREFVFKARMAALEAKEAGTGKRRLFDSGPALGSVEDEMSRNREYQAWGAGRHHVSSDDRHALKKAKKEGRVAEAMLDRRAKMKSDRYAK